jgi:antirestriction protein ArdC
VRIALLAHVPAGQRFRRQRQKGEKSTLICFYKTETKRDPDAQDGEISSADKTRWILRYYLVFNLEQCDLPEKVLATIPKPETTEHNPIEEAEAIASNYPNPPAIEQNTLAAYSPSRDTIVMPAKDLFANAEEYYSTLFHEMAHSTGHTTRLAREGIVEMQPFGSAVYSKEELVAEMGSAFLCGHAGISSRVIDNQAAYINGWLGKLRSDTRLVLTAAAQAQRAADHILNMD